MGAYVIRRILLMFLMLFLVTVAVFILFSLVPTDPARLTCGKACTPEIIEANRERLGLADPLLVQYWEWFKGLFVGRTYAEGTPVEFSCPAPALGYSFRNGEYVTQLIQERMPVTIQLAIGAFILWMVVGVLSGIFAALRRGRWQDRTIVGLALVGYSFPTFFIGLTLLFFVVIKWGILPYPDYVPPTEDPVQWFQTMILPWITVALVYAAFYTRLTRRRCSRRWARTTSAPRGPRGCRERVVIRKHALRAGLTPIVTAAASTSPACWAARSSPRRSSTSTGSAGWPSTSVQDYDLPIIVGHDVVVGGVVRHHRQPDRGPALRRHRPASEAGMSMTAASRSWRSATSRSSSRPRTAWSRPSTASPSTCDRGQTLGIVGESGSGKSVSSLAVMGLLNRKTTRDHRRDLARRRGAASPPPTTGARAARREDGR